ncbi:MAG: alcohol dehydrogenase [Acidobacteria bacterium]|nr:MAG: alcohol dehydrogenase [Acidobacteriota bacterium]
MRRPVFPNLQICESAILPMPGVLLVLCLCTPLVAADWPQYLGPTRNGAYAGPPLSEKWAATGPRVVWRKQIGQGLSGPVVAQSRVILFHRVGDREVVESFDALTGTSQWRHAYPTAYRDDFGFDEGPRAVPVVADGIVFTYGAEGKLHAVELATGKSLWNVDAMRQFDVEKGFFGAAGSPLVEDGRVIANVGGRKGGVVAFDAKSGKGLWTATTDAASYSSGVGATILGRRYAVFLTRNGLVGLDPATGQVRFQRPWRARQAASVNAATPLVIGNAIFVSAEYGPGAGVLQFDGTKLLDVWLSNDVLSNHYATSVHHEGQLYGFHGRQEFGPMFRAVHLQSGKVSWSTDRFGAGTVTLAGNRLLIVRESGELILAAASPKAFQSIAKAQILPPTVRAYPALADGVLYVRNDDTLVALDLR